MFRVVLFILQKMGSLLSQWIDIFKAIAMSSYSQAHFLVPEDDVYRLAAHNICHQKASTSRT
jgi:hypothetical protein